MKKKIILVFFMFLILILFGCTTEEKQPEPLVEAEKTTEILNKEDIIEIHDETIEKQEVFTLTTYPINGLTLTDFCRFSYKKEQTLISDIIEQIGEPDGTTEEHDQYYILYDGTKLAFPVDANGYIYNPYITDSIGRVFANTTSERDTSTENLITVEDIAAVKNGEYTFEGRKALNDFYGGIDKLLSVSNFTVVPFYSAGEKITEERMIEALGMPSGEGGSGEISSYYQLADGTIITYSLVQ